MLKFIKRLLYKILSTSNYLLFTSRAFFFAYSSGLLKLSEIFDTHYYVRKLVNKGDTVIDIGGNLGYYTRIFSKKAGKNGKVISIEPVALFREVLIKNTARLENVEILPFALGAEENKEIEMGIPDSGKDFRHGLTKVIDEDPIEKFQKVYKTTMHTPAYLFGKLEKCNYIKCDVEGYEIHIIPLMREFVQKHKPILQIETGMESREVILPLMNDLGYKAYFVQRRKLLRYVAPDNPPGDLIFIP